MNDKGLQDSFRCGLDSYVENALDRRLVDAKVCAFFPMAGAKYRDQRALMIVGRATNGWLDGEYSARSLCEAAEFDAMWTEIFEHKYGAEDPMALIKLDWNRENAPFWRSAFFRTAHKVLSRLEIVDEQDEDWPSLLVWSNLYKIAPRDGGNPKVLMQRAQEPWCYDLLGQELAVYRPWRVLFMTGADWASPFLSHLGFKQESGHMDEWIEAYGSVSLPGHVEIKVVVTPHPQGKPESEIAEQAANCLRKLTAN